MRSLIFQFTTVLAFWRTTAASPTVKINAGTLKGGTCSGNSNAIYFKSIPYAQPPVNELRFQAPKAAQKFGNRTIDATQTAPACVQFDEQFAESGAQSEDCLYLDVWAPANSSRQSNLPVRVWMYGGDNSAGGLSNPLYDGCPVASTGAIMVAINYRLGPLGFLSMEGTEFRGNQGIQDMLMGLQWVQDNIKAFGGDPKKVLFYGQSAGAIDSFAISTLEQAPKLFSSAIFESGGGTAVFRAEAVQNISSSFTQSLNCTTSTESCLRSASISDMQQIAEKLAAMNSVAATTPNTPTFGPQVDGVVIPVQPTAQGTRVPSVFGTNSEEGTLISFGKYLNTPGPPTGVNASDYDTFLQQTFGDLAPRIKAQYPLSAFNSTPYPPLYAMAEVGTAFTFRCPAKRALEKATQNNIPVWTYRFSHHPKCAWIPQIPQRYVPLTGATHTAEIPFVFGHTRHLPDPNGTCEMTPQEERLSTFMVTAWTSMAARQKPASAALWPKWTNVRSSQGLNIGRRAKPGTVDYSDCELWDEINDILTRKSTA